MTSPDSINDPKKKPLTLEGLVATLDSRFTSSNDVPVSRAAIRPEEWAFLKKHLGGDKR